MATTRKPPEGSPEIDSDQRAALDQYVNELSQLSTPPKEEPGTGGPKPVTDAQWDVMTDRARESWVRQLVDSRLDDLSRDDQMRQHAAAIEELRKKKDESEAPPAGPMPTLMQKIQKILWGEPTP